MRKPSKFFKKRRGIWEQADANTSTLRRNIIRRGAMEAGMDPNPVTAYLKRRRARKHQKKVLKDEIKRLTQQAKK